jgi:hypothetical protein
MQIGAVIEALGQHVVASLKLDIAMVEIADTMVGKLRSQKGDGLPQP